MSQSYTNYFTYATSRPAPLQIAFWSGKYRGVGGRPSPLHPVGTHDLCVRCVKGYSIVILTGTDALRLDTLVRSYTATSNL